MKDFLESTALITGASSGIGLEMARQLAPMAAHLILVARRRDRLEELRQELLGTNPELRVDCQCVDLADKHQVGELIAWLRDNQAKLDFLINNAGLGDHGPFEASDWERVERILQVNVVALTELCHRLIPLLRRHRPGAILNVSSVASFLPVPEMAVYAATKAYVSSFSEALRAELRGTGIAVTHLCPGPVDTEFGEVAQREGTAPEDFRPMPAMFKVSVERVARQALRGVARDRARVLPGFWINVAVLGVALSPMFLLRLFFPSSAERAQLPALQPRLAHE
ncbi:MAG: SDR family oxidoreductase [Verrucomicrobia bacterium]|nr:SDR family oxidoreductase [Verrucomicrobiota bacterium]